MALAPKSRIKTVSSFSGSDFERCSSIHRFRFGEETTKTISRPSIVRSEIVSPSLEIKKIGHEKS